MVTKDQITELYIAMFQRAPSQSEIDYWYNSTTQNGLDAIGLADAMVQAAQNAVHLFGLEDMYPEYANYTPNNYQKTEDIINSVYQTIFNKDKTVDPKGVEYWTKEVLNGKSLGEVIVAMENSANDIAEHPDKYKSEFDAKTLEEAVNATHAFMAKVDAAKDIASQITSVKTDSQSLEEMKNVIKEVKSSDDISKIKTQIESLKQKVEDISNTMNENDNNKTEENNITDLQNLHDHKGYAGATAEQQEEMLESVQKLSDSDKLELYNMLKEWDSKIYDIYNTHDKYDSNIISDIINIDNNFNKQIDELFAKYNIINVGEFTKISSDSMPDDLQKLQEYYNSEKQHYKDLLNILNDMNPTDLNGYKEFFAVDSEDQNKTYSILNSDFETVTNSNNQNNFDNYTDQDSQQIFDSQIDNEYLNFDEMDSDCYNKDLDLSTLSEKQLLALTNELDSFSSNNYQLAISNPTEYYNGLETIYEKYGINASEYIDCIEQQELSSDQTTYDLVIS